MTVCTLNQTAGRGRSGKAWYSPAGTSLAFSFLFRPEPFSLAHPVTIYVGYALRECLQRLSEKKLCIKWPNDIYCEGKKLAGVLSEFHDGYFIIGIGVNLETSAFPPELAEIACSLHEFAREKISPEMLAAQILAWQKSILADSQTVLNNQYLNAIHASLTYDCELYNRDREEKIMRIHGLLPDGRLRVQLTDKNEVTLNA